MSDSGNYRQNWAAYLRHMMADRSQAEFAKAIQATDGQLSKWLSGSTGVTAEKVITIARLLGDSPVHALGRVGWLNVSELTPFRAPRTYGLDEFTDRELAAEIVRRIDAGEAGQALTEPIDATPTDLDAHRERRANVPNAVDTIDHVEAPDLDSLDYAAKRGTRKVDQAPWAE
ncbi:helix-turn-helix transcriptional regulator [Microbacterium sp.]|uniref:helix-turn-helix domain-containing protein n=1 Tax=Microbacterium sp. TaxID=51671 RepID=UPI002810B44E|nr:helix-turn-helix transcriptional regulator [Microbacterium sp.]